VFRDQPLCAEAMAKSMSQKVALALTRNCRIEPGDGVLVGVSGGASSCLLARCLSAKVYSFNARAAQILRHRHSGSKTGPVPEELAVWVESAGEAPLPDIRPVCAELVGQAFPLAAAACFVDPRALAPLMDERLLRELPGLAAGGPSPFELACDDAAACAAAASALRTAVLPIECAFVDDLSPWLPSLVPAGAPGGQGCPAPAPEADSSEGRPTDAAAPAPDLAAARRALLSLVRDRLPTAEARNAAVVALTRRLLRRAAREWGLDHVALGTPADGAAEAVMAGASMGKGRALAVEASPRDEPRAGEGAATASSVTVVRPMLWALRRETAISCRAAAPHLPVLGRAGRARAAPSCPPLPTSSLPNFSTGAPLTLVSAAASRRHGGVTLLARRLVADLQSRFPSTSLSVVRSMQRARPPALPAAPAPAAAAWRSGAAPAGTAAPLDDGSDPHRGIPGACPVCLGPLDAAEAAGSSVPAAMRVGPAGKLEAAAEAAGGGRGSALLRSCYGCRVVFAEALDALPEPAMEGLAALDAAWPRLDG